MEDQSKLSCVHKFDYLPITLLVSFYNERHENMDTNWPPPAPWRERGACNPTNPSDMDIPDSRKRTYAPWSQLPAAVWKACEKSNKLRPRVRVQLCFTCGVKWRSVAVSGDESWYFLATVFNGRFCVSAPDRQISFEARTPNLSAEQDDGAADHATMH